ncbi:Lrp/AsnC family transcriptional regulator [Mitsuaria sp. GD03876]|uniref:Lrp/AsnC family transcriptional regulator n=1 Tax=Mitsuaria sp. GD03876 TaxID=2975399 RepID=UPI00244A92DA|nr:Lrp/AsnC family transcriptional regulator [Mitsuaria sp. GD03876]MDH0865536.1 Lrp/AsnC family transcriptional regulator [Mitsuaria sp. GD03876]
MTDDIDHLLLRLLSQDARQSLKSLAQACGLSAPSVAERLRKMEERGELIGTTVDIDARKFGYQFQALVRIRPLPGHLQVVEQQLIETPQVIECDRITGDDCFLARLQVRSMDELDVALDAFNLHAQTSTAIVKKSPVKRRLPPLD